MANWSRALEEVGEGLLRQQELGGVMYTQAAAKEAARVSGEAKQLESQQEALMERAKLASRHLEDVNKELAKADLVWDEKSGSYNSPLWDMGIKAQQRADSAWGEVYRSRGMKMQGKGQTDWTNIATSVAESFKHQPKKLEDLVIKLKEDPNHEKSLEAIDIVLKGPQFTTLSQPQKRQLRDKVVEVIVTMNLDEIEAPQDVSTGLGGFGPASGIAAIAQSVPWREVSEYLPSPVYGGPSRREGLITTGERLDMSPEAVNARTAGR